MSAFSSGAALPWAVGSGDVAACAAAVDGPQPAALQDLGLTLGSRIEVRWEIHPEDRPPYAKWWGARISACAEAPPGEAGPAYVLAYDPDEGFDAEERRVQLTSEHELVDVEEGDAMSWRREGEAWEPPDTATLGDIVCALPDEADLQEAEAQALGELDPAAQRRLAAGFRDFTDSFKEYMRSKLEAAAAMGSADHFVVTEAMVAEFTQRHRGDAARGAHA